MILVPFLIALVAKRPNPVRERPTRYGFFGEMAGMTNKKIETRKDATEDDGCRSKAIQSRCQIFLAIGPQPSTTREARTLSPPGGSPCRIGGLTPSGTCQSIYPRPAHCQFQHRIQQAFSSRTRWRPPQNVGEPPVEQQHGEAVHQRPTACNRRRLIQR